MAQEARQEQLLTRQRGAASRDVPENDLGLDFGAGSRQERQLMRQRGAGSRQVENIDFGFGFNFRTPSTVGGRRSRDRSKTPGTAGRQPATRKTTPVVDGSNDSRALSESVRSSRTVRQPGSTGQDAGNALPGQPQRKRRRLSEISNMARATSADFPVVEIGDTVSQDVAEIAEEGPVEQGFDLPRNNSPSPPLFFTDDHNNSALSESHSADKENQQATKGQAQKKRKRRSIGQQSLFKKKRKSGTPRDSLPTPSDTQEEGFGGDEHVESPEQFGRTRRWSVETIEPPTGSSPQPDQRSEVSNKVIPRLAKQLRSPSPVQKRPAAALDQPATESTGPAKRRKKRKSVVQGKTKRVSTGTTTSTPSHIANSIEIDDAENVQSDQEELNDFSLDQTSFTDSDSDGQSLRSAYDQGLASVPSRRYRTEEPDHYEANGEADADETYLPDAADAESTPALKRTKANKHHKPAPHRRAYSNASSRSSTTRKKPPSRPTIPITTYRTIDIHALPIIIEEPDQPPHNNDSDLDELSLPNFTTRASPNAVDVLSQACLERIETEVSTLKASGLPRTELNKRIEAVTLFRDTINSQLFHLSQSLDHRLNLEARLRKSRREKADLQARWLEIRQRRDQLDLRKDAVRRQHWENEVLARTRFNVSEAAFGLENAVAGDGENEAEVDEGQGLEVMLRKVARDVSGHDAILETLKAFNVKLERMASQLA